MAFLNDRDRQRIRQIAFEIEDTMRYALEAGVKRLDIFFMIGLPKQDYQSVMDTVDYCKYLMTELDHGPDRRHIPFISPLAPFLDPGSPVFENPEQYGYRFFVRTLEEHRQALVQPSWKYVLNYETEWMNRDQIVDSTYEAGLRLNRLKAQYGLVEQEQAEQTEVRILKARRLIAQIDDIMSIQDAQRRARLLQAIKPQVDKWTLASGRSLIVLAEGRLAEAGSHDDLLARGGSDRTLYDLQHGAK